MSNMVMDMMRIMAWKVGMSLGKMYGPNFVLDIGQQEYMNGKIYTMEDARIIIDIKSGNESGLLDLPTSAGKNATLKNQQEVNDNYGNSNNPYRK